VQFQLSKVLSIKRQGRAEGTVRVSLKQTQAVANDFLAAINLSVINNTAE
jgi:hypothetical protein